MKGRQVVYRDLPLDPRLSHGWLPKASHSQATRNLPPAERSGFDVAFWRVCRGFFNQPSFLGLGTGRNLCSANVKKEFVLVQSWSGWGPLALCRCPSGSGPWAAILSQPHVVGMGLLSLQSMSATALCPSLALLLSPHSGPARRWGQLGRWVSRFPPSLHLGPLEAAPYIALSGRPPLWLL